MFFLVSIFVFAVNWKGDFSLFKMVLDWHSLLSFFCCKNQETISLSSFSNSSLCLCRNKKYHFLCQKLKKQKCLGTQDLLQVHGESRPGVNCSYSALQTKPRESLLFFSPLKHSVHEQHVGYRPCCVADGFFLFVESCKVVQNKFVLHCSQFQPEPNRLFPESSKPM